MLSKKELSMISIDYRHGLLQRTCLSRLLNWFGSLMISVFTSIVFNPVTFLVFIPVIFFAFIPITFFAASVIENLVFRSDGMFGGFVKTSSSPGVCRSPSSSCDDENVSKEKCICPGNWSYIFGKFLDQNASVFPDIRARYQQESEIWVQFFYDQNWSQYQCKRLKPKYPNLLLILPSTFTSCFKGGKEFFCFFLSIDCWTSVFSSIGVNSPVEMFENFS